MKRALMVAVLLGVGLSQMVGELLRVPVLRGIGAASGIAPAPKVFTSVRGLETYSTRFYLEWRGADGGRRSVRLTPEINGRLRGPYQRRNVYGAALAYGPILPPELRDPVMRRALCGERPLLRELGIDPAEVSGDVRVRLEPIGGTDLGNLPRVIEAPCE